MATAEAPKSFHKQKNTKDKAMNIQQNKQVRQAALLVQSRSGPKPLQLFHVFVSEAQVLEEDKEHGPLVTVRHVL